MRTLARRRFIALGVSATAAALSGCVSPGSGDSAHTDWIPASDGGTITAYVDFTVSRETSEINPILPLVLPDRGEGDGSGAELAPDLSQLDEIDDPLVRFPLRTGGRIIALTALSLAVAGLGDLFDPTRPSEGVTELFMAGGVAVGTGEIDASETDEALKSGSTGPFGQLRFEEVGENGAYTLYEPASEGAAAVAVGETAVLVGDTRAEVRRALEAWRGDRERAVEADDAFASLLDEAGSGHVMVGWEGPADFGAYSLGEGSDVVETDLVSATDDVVASVTFAPAAGELTADLALRDPDLDDAAAARLDARLGSSSADRSLSVDGDRVSATATYAGDALDLEFVERGGTTERTTVPGGDDVPPAVADAVPDDAFEFTYDDEEGTVRVDFVAEFEATEVTVRAVESEWEVSTSTPGPTTYLNVPVDPDGDEVVVTVTVDGASGVVARREFP